MTSALDRVLAGAELAPRRAATHFILYVHDQGRSESFYRAVLAIAPRLSVPGMTEFELPGGGVLGLMPERDIREVLGPALPDPAEAHGTPRAELYLLLAAEPDAYYQRALAAGARELSPFQLRSWGHAAGYVLDPDGHVLAFATEPPAPSRLATIRRAVERDAACLAELAERTFRETFAGANRAEDMDQHCRKAYGESIQLAEIRDPGRTTLLSCVDDRLIGFGQLRCGSAPACVEGTKPVEIQRLYVDAPWHGKGIAHALMASLLEAAAARSADVAWLGVWEGNPRAIAFYAKSGFTVVGEHTFILGNDRQRDLVLARRLG